MTATTEGHAVNTSEKPGLSELLNKIAQEPSEKDSKFSKTPWLNVLILLAGWAAMVSVCGLEILRIAGGLKH